MLLIIKNSPNALIDLPDLFFLPSAHNLIVMRRFFLGFSFHLFLATNYSHLIQSKTWSYRLVSTITTNHNLLLLISFHLLILLYFIILPLPPYRKCQIYFPNHLTHTATLTLSHYCSEENSQRNRPYNSFHCQPFPSYWYFSLLIKLKSSLVSPLLKNFHLIRKTFITTVSMLTYPLL